MIDLSDKCLMMIEPDGPATQPVVDELTGMAMRLSLLARPGKNRYRGFHVCVCGEASDSLDHVLDGPQGEVRTNSLLLHYVACHRPEVPACELAKLRALYAWACRGQPLQAAAAPATPGPAGEGGETWPDLSRST